MCFQNINRSNLTLRTSDTMKQDILQRSNQKVKIKRKTIKSCIITGTNPLSLTFRKCKWILTNHMDYVTTSLSINMYLIIKSKITVTSTLIQWDLLYRSFFFPSFPQTISINCRLNTPAIKKSDLHDIYYIFNSVLL